MNEIQKRIQKKKEEIERQRKIRLDRERQERMMKE